MKAQRLRCLRSSASSCFPASASLSTKTANAPSRAAPRVIAEPMPLAPPVTRTTLSLSCKSMLGRLQTIKANGIDAENLFLFFGRARLQIVFDDPLHLLVARGQETHGPVGAEH